MSVKLALIGCGRIAQVAHLPALEKADGIELVAVSDPSVEVAEAVARRYDVPLAHTDQARVLADPEVEAVLIAAPDRFHLPIADQALRAGKHVLVEKPLASTAAESDDPGAVRGAASAPDALVGRRLRPRQGDVAPAQNAGRTAPE